MGVGRYVAVHDALPWLGGRAEVNRLKPDGAGACDCFQRGGDGAARGEGTARAPGGQV